MRVIIVPVTRERFHWLVKNLGKPKKKYREGKCNGANAEGRQSSVARWQDSFCFCQLLHRAFHILDKSDIYFCFIT